MLESRSHALIIKNLYRLLAKQVRRAKSRMISTTHQVSSTPPLSPDLIITTAEPVLAGEDANTLLNPELIVEVSTYESARADRGSTFNLYRQIPLLTDYLVVTAEYPLVEHRYRLSKTKWGIIAESELLTSIAIERYNALLPLDEIYQGVPVKNIYAEALQTTKQLDN